MNILVIGDPHALPGYSNERFRWLGRHVCATRPQVIVCMGDWADLPSLCRHSKAIEVEGSRVSRDLDAFRESLEIVEEEIALYNARRRASRKRKYRPRKVYLLGNHEERLEGVPAEMPAVDGFMGTELVRDIAEARGWEVRDFKERVVIEGFVFCHFLPSGTLGRPVGGANMARSLLTKGHQSCVVGHDHRFVYAKDERWDGTKIHGFSAGCYAHPEYNEPWCRQTEEMWDRGLLTLKGVKDGAIEGFEWISISELERKYG